MLDEGRVKDQGFIIVSKESNAESNKHNENLFSFYF